MIVNKRYLASKNLNVYDLFIFGIILQNASEDMSEDLITHLMNEDYRLYESMGLTHLVKKKKVADHDYKVIRLTSKGKDVYRNAQILDFTIEDEKLLEYITKLYSDLEKPIGNAERVKQLLAWFRVETAYSRKLIYIATKAYFNSAVEAKKEQYIPSLENLLWKANNVFSTKWTLADSKLYQYIQEHKKELNANL